MAKKNSTFSHKLNTFGIKYYILEDKFMSLKVARLKSYIEHLNSEEVSVKLVWTGWPPLMFGGCMRLGYKQAIWAMKYPYPLSYQTEWSRNHAFCRKARKNVQQYLFNASNKYIKYMRANPTQI
jgi:hypothetical protein